MSWLYLAVSAVLCYQLLAARSLQTESMKVYQELKKGDLPGARRAVSMIVGRDTERLSEAGVTKAAVETVADVYKRQSLRRPVSLRRPWERFWSAWTGI